MKQALCAFISMPSNATGVPITRQPLESASRTLNLIPAPKKSGVITADTPAINWQDHLQSLPKENYQEAVYLYSPEDCFQQLRTGNFFSIMDVHFYEPRKALYILVPVPCADK
jgi:hypothetical protein